jgi:hypothetical protein
MVIFLSMLIQKSCAIISGATLAKKNHKKWFSYPEILVKKNNNQSNNGIELIFDL